MEQKNELKPCPFCGGKALLRTRELYYYGRNDHGDKKVRQSVYCYCGKCKARSSPVVETIVKPLENPNYIPVDMYEKAFEYWNERC